MATKNQNNIDNDLIINKLIELMGGGILDLQNKVSVILQRLEEIQDVISSHDFTTSQTPSPTHYTITDDVIKDSINKLLPRISHSRLWYSVIKVLVDNDVDFDLKSACQHIQLLFPGVSPKINIKDLSSMCYASFAKEYEYWDLNGPISRTNDLLRYIKLANDFSNLIHQ